MERQSIVTASPQKLVNSFSIAGFAIAGLLGLSHTPALSAETMESNQRAKASEVSNAASTIKLKGAVVEVEVTLNNLRDARLSISRVRKAAANLYDEVTRQQVNMRHNPMLIGTTVISLPAPSFTGKVLPARKRWVDASMAELGPIINLFKEDVDDAIENNRQSNVSEPVKVALSPLRSDAFKSVESSFAIYKNLQTLTAGNDYNNTAIADEVKKLDTHMKALDLSLKKGISILQKEVKSSSLFKGWHF